jgi:hypothetical protein
LTIKVETIEKLIPPLNLYMEKASGRRDSPFRDESPAFVKEAFTESVNEAFEAYKSNPTTFDIATYMETWTEDFRVWHGHAREMFEVLTGQKQAQKENENPQIEESNMNTNFSTQSVFEAKKQPKKMLSAPKRNKIQQALALFKKSFDELFF